jgi:hypothetical protein
MSVTKQIVKLLSAKYNFSFEEGLEYATTQLKTLKLMKKEEKAAKAEKKAEKKAKKQNNTETNVNATNNNAVAPAETEVKPRKPITRSSTSATRARLAKLIEDDKLKKLAAAAK